METQYAHHPEASNFYFYLFLTLGPIVVVSVFYIGMKIAHRLENRGKNNKRENGGTRTDLEGR